MNRRHVHAAWRKVKDEPPGLGAGRCNSCVGDTEEVLEIWAGLVRLRLCRGCAESVGLELKR